MHSDGVSGNSVLDVKITAFGRILYNWLNRDNHQASFRPLLPTQYPPTPILSTLLTRTEHTSRPMESLLENLEAARDSTR